MPDAINFTIKTASTPEELREVGRLRYQVYIEELGKKSVTADHGSKILLDELDPQCEVLYASFNNEVVATLRILFGNRWIPPQYYEYYDLNSFNEFSPTTFCFCSRLMIKKDHRKGLLLNKLLIHIYVRAQKEGMLLNFIGCLPSLIPLYEMLGFRRFKSGIFRTDLGNDFAMVLVGDDREHLKQVGSPWASIAEEYPATDGRTAWFNQKFPSYSSATSGRIMGTEQLLDTLAQHINPAEIDLLQGIDLGDLDSLFKSSVILDLQSGDRVLKESDSGTELFVVLSGSVEIQVLQHNGKILSLESLGKGQVFGEMAFITNSQRSADVICTSDSRLLAVSQSFFERMMVSSPAVASRLLLNLSRILINKVNLSREMLRAAP